MVFSITAQISEMDFSVYKTKKQVEMEFSMTMLTRDLARWLP